jgi:hypothetical protein
MKLSMAITLDGLVRALRCKEHELAEQAEQNRRPRIRAAGLPPVRRERAVPSADRGDAHGRRR